MRRHPVGSSKFGQLVGVYGIWKDVFRVGLCYLFLFFVFQIQPFNRIQWRSCVVRLWFVVRVLFVGGVKLRREERQYVIKDDI